MSDIAIEIINGLHSDIDEIIRVAKTNPHDIQGFLKANYAKQWRDTDGYEVSLLDVNKNIQAGRAHDTVELKDMNELLASLRESCFRLDNELVLRMDSATKIIRKHFGKE